MTAAIFGLLGVLIGGVLNYAATVAVEQRRLRREARAASRLLGRELTGALYGLREWLRDAAVNAPTREDLLRFPAWKLYHSAAAQSLEPSVWDAVSDAYLLLYTIRTRDDFTGALDLTAMRHLEKTEAAVLRAIDALRPGAQAALSRPGSEG